MTIQLLKAIAVGCLCLLSAGACSGKSDQPTAAFTISQHGDVLNVSIRNTGSTPLAVDRAFALSGIAGGGNINLIPVDEGGILFKVCSHIDASPGYSEPSSLSVGKEVSGEIVNVSLVKKLYCLPDGDYVLSALYFDSRGNQFHSNTIKMQIGAAI